MNLQQLYYFRKLAEVQHYTEAAKALYITQPSLSDSIASLESELSVALFQKKGRNVQLTKYGEEFSQYVNQSLEILEHGIALMKEKSDSMTGTIDIGCIPTLLGDFLPDALDLYHEHHPQVNFNIFHEKSIPVAEGVSAGTYDIGSVPWWSTWTICSLFPSPTRSLSSSCEMTIRWRSMTPSSCLP